MGFTGTRGRRPTLSLFVALLLGIWALAASNTNAALQAGCTQSGSLVTCSYTTQAERASFAVPAGVTSVNVHAVGGTGGAPTLGPPSAPAGGSAATIGATLNLSPGSVLSIQVAGNGNLSGAGGGGAGCLGGGGASSVSGTSGPLLIAAGGGGNGCGPFSMEYTGGGRGGNAGANGNPPGVGNAAGGNAGTSTAGGAGGAGGTGVVAGAQGGAGSPGVGGAGGSGASGAGEAGGGGGGGLYGGGGGGQGATGSGVNGDLPGGGGGGGSSLVPAGGSLGIDSTATPLVTVSYSAPTSGTPGSPGTPPSSSTKILTARARVVHGKAKLKIACDGLASCYGRLAVTRKLRVRRLKRIHGQLRSVTVTKFSPVATARYALAGGKSATVTLRIRRSALALLRRHSLHVRATASVAGGQNASRTVILTRARPRRR